jgi:hypothetical protein
MSIPRYSISIRFQIAALVYLMVQATLFGVGIVIVLATPLSAFAMQLVPWVVVVSAVISGPLSWMIAPQLCTPFENRVAAQSPAVIGQDPAPRLSYILAPLPVETTAPASRQAFSRLERRDVRPAESREIA